MKFLKSIIQKFIKEDKKILGRWNIEYCDKKMNNNSVSYTAGGRLKFFKGKKLSDGYF